MGRAVNNWNVSLQAAQIDVQFSFAGESPEITSTQSRIVIHRGSTFHNQRHLAETYLVLKTAPDVEGAVITIDMGVKDPETLISVITHELGHTLGLQDCPTCKRGTTIMSLYRGRNQSNETSAPTMCDRVVVAGGYQN